MQSKQVPIGYASRRALVVRSVAAPSSPSTTQTVAVKKTALKEWNVAIDALSRGDLTIVMRKGGIKEPVFKPSGRAFFLFPTSFHSDTQLLKPALGGRYTEALALEPKKMSHIPLTTYVQITGAWVTEDAAVLDALDDLHIWTPEFVEARLKWRGAQPLTLLELRAWRLALPLQLATREEYFGCFSNLELSGAAEVPSTVAAVPAVSDADFAQRQAVLRQRLTKVKVSELQL